MRLRTTGRTNRPLKRPNTTTRRKTLKKVRKTWDLDPASRTKARKVENPPLKTAGPDYHNFIKNSKKTRDSNNTYFSQSKLHSLVSGSTVCQEGVSYVD